MQKQRHLISVFFFFLLLSGIFYAISQTPLGTGVRGLTEIVVSPFRNGVLTVFAANSSKPTPLQKLQSENLELRSQLVHFEDQAKEMQALRDQFAVTAINPQTLLPTRIVGRRTIVPGFSSPDQLILNKGSSDGVHVGSTVLYKDVFLGQIASVTDHLSLLNLSYQKNFSITATTADTGALGVVKGQGQGEMLLDNVVLSDSLKNGSNVITKGSEDPSGKGVPPGLIIGKIISIDKKPSALFQTAKLQQILDITRLDTVFVITQSDH